MADGRYTVGGREFDHHAMGRRCGCDVDEVELLVRKQFGGVGVGASAERGCGATNPLLINVADRDKFDLGDLCPGMQVVLREEAGADYRESIGHSSTSRDGSVIHSLHEPTYIREPGRPASSMASTFWAAVTPEPQ